MSLYEVIGDLLSGAGEVLSSGEIRGTNERAERDLRQVALLTRRLAAMWPDLFATLERENAVLADTLDDVRQRFEAEGQPVPPREAAPADPIALNRQLLRALNELEARLLAHSDQEWALQARLVLRRGLTEVVGLQGVIVEIGWQT